MTNLIKLLPDFVLLEPIVYSPAQMVQALTEAHNAEHFENAMEEIAAEYNTRHDPATQAWLEAAKHEAADAA